ncbi:MAG: lactate racemase domain-containing protein, partial [bacterium]
MKQKIPWGKDEFLEFELPRGWKLAGVMEPKVRAPIADVAAELDSALKQPIGLPPLTQLAKGKRKVVVVVDDISRPTPAYLLIERILK